MATDASSKTKKYSGWWGKGPEPKEAEFLHWRNDVKLAIRLKKLQSGLLDS